MTNLIDEILGPAGEQPDGGTPAAEPAPAEDVAAAVRDEAESLEREIQTKTQELEQLRERHATIAGVDAAALAAVERTQDPYFWLASAAAREGVVVDQGVARDGACTVLELDGGEPLAFHRGIVGALSKEQQQLYCMEREVRRPRDEERARIEVFRQAATACAGEETVQERIACLSRELTRRGASV